MGFRHINNYNLLKILSYEISNDGSEKTLLRYDHSTQGAISVRTDNSLPNGFEANEGEIISTKYCKKDFKPKKALTAQEVIENFNAVNTSELEPYRHGSLNGDNSKELSDARNVVARAIKLANRAMGKEGSVIKQEEKPAQEEVIRDGSVKHVSVLHATVNGDETNIVGFSDRSIDIDPATNEPVQMQASDIVDFSIRAVKGKKPELSFGEIMVDNGRFASFENGERAKTVIGAKRRIGSDIDIAADRNYTGTECVNDAVAITAEIFNRLGFNVNQR